ncbi:MAG: imidazole glycerol phosphate synthase subunit HisH, partial [Cyanobacteria bacterium J06639_18]
MLRIICKGLEKAGAIPKITDYSKDLERADAVVLPGVG